VSASEIIKELPKLSVAERQAILDKLRELDEATVRTRVKIGVPVRVHYAGEGDSMLVDRVILDEE
jgi:mRNA-degrading endonuclease RelE of RelBE toxin-antitoxin system